MIPPENAKPDPPCAEANPQDLEIPSGSLLPVAPGSIRYGDSTGAATGSFHTSVLPTPINAAGLLKAFWQRWHLALAVGLLLGGAAGGAMWIMKPPKFTAYALLRVASAEPRLLEDNRNNDPTRSLTYQKTQAALITSRPVLRGALREEKVRQLGLVQQQQDPESWLEKELKVGYIEDTDILRISLAGRAPKELATLVNAIHESYMAQIVDAERKQLLALRDDLERIVHASQDKLRRQRQELRGLAEALKTGDSQALLTKQRNTLEEYAALKREFAGVQSQLRHAQLRLAAQKARLKSGENLAVPDSLVEQYLEIDPAVQKQVLEVARLQESVARFAEATTSDSPLRVHAKQNLESAQQSLEKIRNERRPDIVKKVRQKIRDQAESGFGSVEEEISVLQGQQQAMVEEVKRAGDEAERIGTSSLELELKRTDMEQAEAVVRQLQTEKERLQAELQSTGRRRVTLLQAAEPPETPNFREHVQETVLVGLFAFGLGALGITFRELRARWINTPHEVVQELGMRVYGTLPALTHWSGEAQAELDRPQNRAPARLMMESVDSVRTMLLGDEEATALRTLMITSARSREGKTMLAGQLAISFARSGLRTLLIDCDLRKPSLHRLIGLPQAPGVCEVLRGEVALAEAIRTTEVAGLSLLPAGQLSHVVLSSLMREPGRQLFEQARANYDLVLVDSCPILPVADSLLLGKHVDAAVMSIRPRVSRANLVQEACDRLRAVRIRVLGAVVNGVRGYHDKDYYRYYLSE